jgi:aryl-alcohol dehydrogenase-like predicted oxidoreductase
MIPLTITIAANSQQPLHVNRLGYGTMRLTGEGIYGEPSNRPEALQILQAAVACGINFLDTADYYGEDVTNRLIAEALYPYNSDLVICTKVGATRKPDKSWIAYNSPSDLQTSIENNLRTLKIDQVQLVHFRVMPHNTMPFEKSMEVMFAMQQAGKILHVGVSNVTPEELTTAMSMGTIATVENMYGHGQRTTLKTPHGENRGGEEVIAICEANSIPLIPYFSLVNGLHKSDNRIATIAEKYDATEAQVNIAWLLHRSPWLLPIPGTSSFAHFIENRKADTISLTEEDMAFLG